MDKLLTFHISTKRSTSDLRMRSFILSENKSLLEKSPFRRVVHIVDGAGFACNIIVAYHIVGAYIIFVAEP